MKEKNVLVLNDDEDTIGEKLYKLRKRKSRSYYLIENSFERMKGEKNEG